MAALDAGATGVVSASSERSTQRRLLLIGGATYLVWWFAVEGLLPGAYNPLPTRLVVVAYFFAAFAASFAESVTTSTVERALTAGVWLLTAHYFYLVHRNAGDMPWAMGAYIVAIAAGACLRSRRAQLTYSLFTMSLAGLVATFDPVLLRSIFLPGLATMLILSNMTWHTRSLLEAERAERVIADAKRAAAEASVAAREEFIAIATHELYTPLTALQLTLESLCSRLGEHGASLSREKLHERLERCQRHVGRLVGLVQELLDTSRLGPTGTMRPFESVRLVALAEEVASLFAVGGAGEETSIAITGDVDLKLRCDRLAIEQVVTNLLRNALKFGAGKPVRVGIESTTTGARVSVADAGIGIAPADHARIFGRFERAVSVSHYGGMGLGLYIVQQIVERHGGSIRVESALGQGATFIVELPGREVDAGTLPRDLTAAVEVC